MGRLRVSPFDFDRLPDLDNASVGNFSFDILREQSIFRLTASAFLSFFIKERVEGERLLP